MAGLYNGPARGGTRGGKDQFNWEDVKEDKQAQNYLGHSVKAPVGRWQNNKDLTWYAKKSKVDLIAAQKAEFKLAKEREADLMAQMLGEKPMEAPKGDMSRIEKNKLYKRGEAEEGTVAAEIENESFGERVEGLGYAPIKIDNLREQMDVTTHEREEGTAVNDLLKAHAEGTADHHEEREGGHAHEDHDHAALLAAIEAAGAYGGDEGSAGIDPNDKKAMKKRMKKLEKEDKKRKKAEKKAAKKERKGEGKRKRDDSDSDSDDEKRRARAGSEEGRRRERDDSGRERERDQERRRDRSRSRSRDRDRRSRSRSRDRDRRPRRD